MAFSIGVLAGMGPGSTAPFIHMLVNAVICQHFSRHFALG